MNLCQKKQAHPQPTDPNDVGDAWIWKAIALPSRLRVVNHLSHDRRESEATAFLAAFKARTDGRPPLFTSDKLPAYTEALIANYSTAQAPPTKRGRGRPRQAPRRVVDSELRYALVRRFRRRWCARRSVRDVRWSASVCRRKLTCCVKRRATFGQARR